MSGFVNILSPKMIEVVEQRLCRQVLSQNFDANQYRKNKEKLVEKTRVHCMFS